MLSLIVGAWLIERSDVPVAPAIVGDRGGGDRRRCCSPGSLADEDYMSEPGLLAGARRCTARLRRRAGRSSAAPRSGCAARGESDARTIVEPDRRRSRARCSRRSRCWSPPSLLSRARVLRLGAARAPPPRRRRSTKASESCVDQARTRRRRRAQARDARAGGRRGAARRCSREILRRGTYYPDCVSVFPSVTPAASASITTGTLARRARRALDLLVPPRRGRYVDYGSSGAAVRTFGVLRTITDTVYNMNFDHLSRAHPDGVRAARRRRACARPARRS